ncbi:hypothetical protein [Parasphingopyxis lamellibrachiae]|uniref:Uncharacterized protein n=1 Tax=Parasphingopyxis lamellibrachiae TaxID=680125 RepID=A0A3D9FHM8_9SPHN|nr:hypothetical protein [Parasphingopyxis lamellibrachiae]RED17293.1 hypothetical protein DFR46_2333 [Parasphingopyxis lamellibrachiae]
MTAGERGWWWRCAGAGLVTLAISYYFGEIPNIEGCAVDAGEASIGSIIAFELVRSPSDVAALFGADPCTASFLAAMRHATWVDALGFIPAYSAFLICALIGLRRYGGSLSGIGVAAVAAAAVFDQIEGFWLFSIMDGLPGSQGEINWLIPAVRAKFLLLGVGAIVIGVLLTRRKGLGFLFGPIIALGGMMTTALIADDRYIALTVQGSAVAWLTLFLAALVYAIVGMKLRTLASGDEEEGPATGP